MCATDVHATINLEAPGKHSGWLRIPHSVNRSAYGAVQVPIHTIGNGRAPRVLLIAGNHGDEFEGQIVLTRLIQQVKAQEIRGTLVILPSLNSAAVRAGTRISPLDGGNLNRLFPGDPYGTPTQKLAHFVEHILMARADVVVDLHSGGNSMDYLPLASTHFAPDAPIELKQRSLEALKAMRMTRAMVFETPAGPGPTSDAAKRQGALFFSGEYGGCGAVTQDTLARTERALMGLLGYLDVTDVPSFAPVESNLLALPPPHVHAYAPVDGVFVAQKAMGDWITRGEVIGLIYTPERPEHPALEIRSEDTGLLICQRHPARVEAGDFLAHLAQPVDWPLS